MGEGELNELSARNGESEHRGNNQDLAMSFIEREQDNKARCPGCRV